jgi:hypothetical protein
MRGCIILQISLSSSYFSFPFASLAACCPLPQHMRHATCPLYPQPQPLCQLWLKCRARRSHRCSSLVARLSFVY